MSSNHHHLDRFYSPLATLEQKPHQGRRLNEQSGRAKWPARGVYFFREAGEYRSSRPDSPRVVRVGTHAVSAGAGSTLWGRLRTHRGARDGGGNHRGSVFRLHVGAALLARDRETLPSWGVGSSAPRSVRVHEVEHEKRVSEYIGAMSVLWVDVPDEPGPGSMRAYIERNAIALLSNHFAPIDCASRQWLGRHSPREEIRQSALWNLNHVRQDCEPKFLDTLEACVERTLKNS